MNRFLKRYSAFLDVKKLKNLKIPKAIRINTLKIDEETLLRRFLREKVIVEKIDFLDYGYSIKESRFSLGSTPEFLLGYYYIQEAASQLPVQVLMPLSTDIVLDMAASPGGKTTQIAQYMENKGVLVAVEKEKHRLDSLISNIERIGVKNCIVYNIDASNIHTLNMQFDKILLDAPCSGNFLTDPKWFDKKSVNGFAERRELQKKLLAAGIRALKKGGILVYSTCSFEPEENEEVIDWALRSLPINIEKIELQIGAPALESFEGKKFSKELQKCIRIIPYERNTQPFFIAKLSKTI
ncbi:MAG: RsmB/NOP family class I SAM-dependent RNA methyltransferase [Candidatus Woesearchaeota archaeon]